MAGELLQEIDEVVLGRFQPHRRGGDLNGPGRAGDSQNLCISRAVRVFKRCSEKGDVPPLWVSEGGLEPPCPLRALAPQASASAYSATRTRDAWGTHRLSYLSKPNVPRRVPRPVNLATRGGCLTPQRPLPGARHLGRASAAPHQRASVPAL